MTSCSATTTIREALKEHSLAPDDHERCGECGRHLDGDHTSGCRCPAALNALASLEQLVEAAWRVLYLVDIGDGSDSVTEADDALRAALAAVGPGEETAG